MIVEINQFKAPIISSEEFNILNESEIDQLYREYLLIEDLWWENFSKLKKINLILVGESPLSFKNYIYNKDVNANTSFLYKRHIENIFIKIEKESSLAGKEDFLGALLDLGILVLDLFPYALNQELNLNYARIYKRNKISEIACRNIFLESSAWHLEPKIKEITRKTTESSTYAFRYARNFNMVDGLDVENPFSGIEIEAIYKDRNDLDSDVLYGFFKK